MKKYIYLSMTGAVVGLVCVGVYVNTAEAQEIRGAQNTRLENNFEIQRLPAETKRPLVEMQRPLVETQRPSVETRVETRAEIRMGAQNNNMAERRATSTMFRININQEERMSERFASSVTQAQRALMTVVNNLNSISERIENHLNSVETKTEEQLAALVIINETQVTFTEITVSIDALSSISFNSENPRISINELKETTQEIRINIRDTHRKLMEVVRIIKNN